MKTKHKKTDIWNGNEWVEAKIWVTATDETRSSWKDCKNRKAKLVVPVKSEKEATEIKKVLLGRSDMKRINICKNRPIYHRSEHLVYTKPYEIVKGWESNLHLQSKEKKRK